MAFVRLLEVGANVVGIQFFGRRRGAAGHLCLLDEHDGIALAHNIAWRHRDVSHDAVAVCGDDMLHLHGFDHGDLLTGADLVSNGYVHRNDRPLNRRTQAGGTLWSGDR